MYLCDYILKNKIQEYFGSNHLVLFEIKAKGVSLLDISGVLNLCIRNFGADPA